MSIRSIHHHFCGPASEGYRPRRTNLRLVCAPIALHPRRALRNCVACLTLPCLKRQTAASAEKRLAAVCTGVASGDVRAKSLVHLENELQRELN